MSEWTTYYSIAFVISTFFSGMIFWFAHRYNRIGIDVALGPQKIHQGHVPRTGGVAVFIAVSATFGLFQKPLPAFLLFAATPLFVTGLVEDFTGLVPGKIRFLVSLITGCLFCWFTGYQITDVDVDVFNFFLAIPLISIILTALAVSAMANAVNIVDGLNGLAGISVLLMSASFGFMSAINADLELQVICFLTFFSVLGFLVWNFPFGKVFMGDGGAYFLGTLIAGVAVLLPERNNTVSAFFSLLIIIYPIYELMRSAVRRIITNSSHPFEPDNQHLHSVIYKSITSRFLIAKPMKNSLAALVALFFPASSCIWAISFSSDELMLIVGVLFFILLYEVFMVIALLLTKAETTTTKL